MPSIDGGVCRYTPRCLIHTGEKTLPIHIRRGARERAYSAVLMPEEVREIRRMYDAGVRRYIIAHKFGVSESTVFDIGLRRTWKWVT